LAQVLPISYLVCACQFALGLALPMEYNSGRTPVDPTMATDFDFELAQFQMLDEDGSGTVPCQELRRGRARTCQTAEVASIAMGRENVRRSPLSSSVEFSMWDSSIVKQLGRTIHYKGFAARVNFDDQDTQIEKKHLMELFRDANPDTIVWDGDDYQPDSFTALIPDIYSSTHPRLVMFLSDTPEEKARVTASWTPTKLPITCYLLNAELSFEQLGIEALQATQSKTVFCFGGGAVLEKEWQASPKDVNFVLARTQRDGPNPGDRPQISPLDKFFILGGKHHNLENTGVPREGRRHSQPLLQLGCLRHM